MEKLHRMCSIIQDRAEGIMVKPQAILEIADTLLCLPFTTACLEEST